MSISFQPGQVRFGDHQSTTPVANFKENAGQYLSGADSGGDRPPGVLRTGSRPYALVREERAFKPTIPNGALRGSEGGRPAGVPRLQVDA